MIKGSTQVHKTGKGHLKRAVALALLGVGLWQGAGEAMTEDTISAYGKDIFQVQYYGLTDKESDVDGSAWGDGDSTKGLTYDLQADIKEALSRAFGQWADLLGQGAKNSRPLQFFVGTYDASNAYAGGMVAENGTFSTGLNEVLQGAKSSPETTIDEATAVVNKTIAEEDLSPETSTAFGFIGIGKYLGVDQEDGCYGFSAAEPGQLVNLDEEIALQPIMYHEIAHALGIIAEAKKNDDGTYSLGTVSEFSRHLVDTYGTHLEPGMTIKTTDPGGGDGGKSFFVTNDSSDDGNKGYDVFFVGDNVTDALGGATFKSKTGEEVSGIPVNPLEDGSDSEDAPELSHLELARSLMSHQAYRSYTTFMEECRVHRQERLCGRGEYQGRGKHQRQYRE